MVPSYPGGGGIAPPTHTPPTVDMYAPPSSHVPGAWNDPPTLRHTKKVMVVYIKILGAFKIFESIVIILFSHFKLLATKGCSSAPSNDEPISCCSC